MRCLTVNPIGARLTEIFVIAHRPKELVESNRLPGFDENGQASEVQSMVKGDGLAIDKSAFLRIYNELRQFRGFFATSSGVATPSARRACGN